VTKNNRNLLAIVRKWLEALPKRPSIAILIILIGPVATLATFSDNLTKFLRSLEYVSDRLQFGIAKRYVTAQGGGFLRLADGYWIQTVDQTLTDRHRNALWIHAETCQVAAQLRPSALQEFRKDRTYIYLYDSSRSKSNDATDPLLMRIPVAGGQVECSYANPIQWVPVFRVCRERCPGVPPLAGFAKGGGETETS